MNKTQMAKELASQVEDLTQAGAGEIIDALFDPTDGIIATELATAGTDQKVSIGGFGTFEVRERSARTARNPRTGETVHVPARKHPAFKAAKALKDCVA